MIIYFINSNNFSTKITKSQRGQRVVQAAQGRTDNFHCGGPQLQVSH